MVDGRYREKSAILKNYFSEYARIRYRVFVEIEWFIFLCNEVCLEGIRQLSPAELKILRAISTNFELPDAARVKSFEAKTNHDVKAVEYFIKEHLGAYPKLALVSEFIHFGCTSEDINNWSYNLLLKDLSTKEFVQLVYGVMEKLVEMAKKYKAFPCCAYARTTGEPDNSGKN